MPYSFCPVSSLKCANTAFESLICDFTYTDNDIGAEGAEALASALGRLTHLNELDMHGSFDRHHVRRFSCVYVFIEHKCRSQASAPFCPLAE